MNRRRWVPIVMVFLMVVPLSVPAFGWDTIISFGDSLSDDGNGGYNNFPDIIPPGATGPASNGPVWLDYLAESMMGVALEGHAISGAQTSGPIKQFGDIGMEAQVDRYLASLGVIPEGGHDLSGILFTIWIGGNDFLANPTNPFAVIETAINRIEAAIQDLVDAGADDILVMTMPDLGLAPGVSIQGDEAKFAYTTASEIFNEALTERICTLRAINKGTKFYMADTFKLLQYAVENGQELGFENVYYPCTWPNGPSCDVAIFWDGIHPTTATHQYLAALALGQVKHGRLDKEMKALLKKLNPIHPRMPFVVQCGN